MHQPGLDQRHREKKRRDQQRNTLICTLRKIYGPNFTKGAADTYKLPDVLEEMDDRSLSWLVRHHERGELEAKIKRAG